MKDRIDAILRRPQAEYLEGLLPPRDGLVAEMEEEAARRGIPISDPEVARLLEIVARSSRPERVLEVGSAIGYGALAMARGAEGARIVCLERDPEMAAEARGWLERAGVAERVEWVLGEALDTLPGLAPPFGLAYLDADKASYRRLLDLLLPKLTVGGVVMVDNLLWKGRVAEPGPEDDPEAEAIAAFNGYFMMHPQLASTLLPLGDGVGIAVKKRPLMTELGGPW